MERSEFAGSPSVRGLSTEEVTGLVQSWDEQFPGKGRGIVEILGPFYSQSFFIDLMPKSAEVEEWCRLAIFWEHVPGVRAIQAASLRALLAGPTLNTEDPEVGRVTFLDRLESSLERDRNCYLQSMVNPLKASLYHLFEPKVTEHLGGPSMERIREILQKSLWEELKLDLRLILEVGEYMNGWKGQRSRVNFKLMFDHMHTISLNLWACLYFAVAYEIIGGDRSKHFGPLLEQWHFVLFTGFDKQGNLVVLTR